MKIHEFQAKEILKRFSVAVPEGGVAFFVEDAEKIAKSNQDSFVSIDSLFLSCIKSDDQIEKILKKFLLL